MLAVTAPGNGHPSKDRSTGYDETLATDWVEFERIIFFCSCLSWLELQIFKVLERLRSNCRAARTPMYLYSCAGREARSALFLRSSITLAWTSCVDWKCHALQRSDTKLCSERWSQQTHLEIVIKLCASARLYVWSSLRWGQEQLGRRTDCAP